MIAAPKEHFVATENPCKLCAPFGASWAFAGIEGCLPLLHGSQGCSTYIRRYLIGHFREPVDVASTNFHESAAIFGGRENLFTALDNIVRQYSPKVIGVATTCLAETIGDDVPGMLREYRRARAGQGLPALVHVSTASYRGTHEDGFQATVRAVVEQLVDRGAVGKREGVNVLPGMVSPADLRWLRAICGDFELPCTLLPDYAETLDGPAWSEYHRIPPGGTPVAAIGRMGLARASVEFTTSRPGEGTASALLEERCGVQAVRIAQPIGVRATDAFLAELERIADRSTPAAESALRGRLVDAYVDGHKYVFEKRAVLYGEQDLVVALAGFCAEIGLIPAVCASGGKTGRLAEAVAAVVPNAADVTVLEGVDFAEIEDVAAEAGPDLMIGNSNGAKIARRLDVPLVRVGMPVHDRIGAARIRTLGYEGTQQLFDRVVNALIEVRQEASPVGYTHM